MAEQHPVFGQIDNAVAQIRFRDHAVKNALLEATGFAADDPESDAPEVMALWKGGRLVALQIEQSLIDEYRERTLPVEGESSDRHRQRAMEAMMEFNTLVNGVILGARLKWLQDVGERIPEGLGGGVG